MTYLVKTTAARRYRRKPSALSDFFDDIAKQLSGETKQSQCLAQANALVAPFDQRIDDIIKNWNPTGFYVPDDLRSLVASVMLVVQQGQATLDRAALEHSASQDDILRATDDLARAGQRSLDYLQAATAAEQQGIRVVNAPGFKRWVTDSMGAASSAAVTASTIACITPWWVGALALFQTAFDQAWSVIKAAVGAVVAIGETALKVAGDLPELYDSLKWVALALGGYWIWVSYLKPHP